MINLFLHHLNACKVKLSFQIDKADSLDNWIFILLFGTAYRCKKYRICQQNDWKLQYLTTKNRKHWYLSWKRFPTLVQVYFQPWGIPAAKSLDSSSPWSSSSTSSSPFQDLLHCSCTLQSKCKLLCKATHYHHTSIALFGKCCGIHRKLIPSRLVELGSGQSKRSQGVFPSVAIHGLPVLGLFLAVKLSSREKLGSWLT